MAKPAVRSIREDRTFHIVNYGVLAIFTILVLYPLVFVFAASVSDPAAVNAGEVLLWPVGFELDGFTKILGSSTLVRGLMNSVIYTVAGMLYGTALTLLAGYVISRPDLPFRRFFAIYFLIPMVVPASIIPIYLVVYELHLINTMAGVVLPTAMSMFNVLVTRAFYQASVPEEVLESAQLDGAGEFRTFLQIVMPLSKPIIAVNMLFYAIAAWNAWFPTFLYLNDEELYPLQLMLREILVQSQVDASQVGGALEDLVQKKELFDQLKYAFIVIAMIPPLVAYPFVQRHFVKGVMLGVGK